MTRERIRNTAGAAAFFELLERRELFDGTALMTPHTATPHPRVHAAAIHAAAARKLHAASSLGGTGITAEYFSDSALTDALLTRTDPTINFAGAKGYAADLKQAAGARWTGQIAVPTSGTYTFSVISNGPARVYVDGKELLISGGGSARSTTPIALVAGTRYGFRMEYTKAAGTNPSLKLFWALAKQKQQVVPQTSLFPTAMPSLGAVASGLIGQYYVGDDFQTLAMTRVDPSIAFNFGTATPDASIPAHGAFSILWTGQFTPATSGDYTFKATADDGVRVYVDGQLVVDDYKLQSVESSSGTIILNGGRPYDLKVQYFNSTKFGQAKLAYGLGNGPQQPLAGSALTSTPPSSAGVLTSTGEGSDDVTLTWTGSTTATGYQVVESTDAGQTWQAVGTTAAGRTTFDVTGLSVDTAYEFRVAPLGSTETSIASNVITVTTLTLPPATATAVTTGPTGVDLSWAAVAGATGYVVLASVDGGETAPVGTVAADVTTYPVDALVPGVSYVFEVEATNSAGAPSDPAATSPTATPSTAPTALLFTDLSTTTVTLNWVDTIGEGGFAVERSSDGQTGWVAVGTTAVNVTTYTDTGLSAGTTYVYRVRGLSAGDPTVESGPSNVLGVPTVTAAPTGPAVTAHSDTRLDLTWDDVAGEAGFTVLAWFDGGATFAPAGTTPAGTRRFSAQPLFPGTNYEFAVEAVNSVGRLSAPSVVVTGTTTPLAPAAVTALGLSAATSLVTWTPVVAATSYDLERSADGGTTWATIAAPAAGTVTYGDTGLSAGTRYSYRVRAVDAGGAGDPSVVAVALTIPAIPSLSLAGVDVNTSTVSFPAVTGAASYVVQRSMDGQTGWTNVTTVTPPAAPTGAVRPAVGTPLAATVDNVAPSTVYYYRAIATNATGSSAPSAVVGQMTAPLAKYASASQLYGATTTGIYSLDMLAGTSTQIGQLMPGAYAANRNPADDDVYYFVGNTATPTVYKWDPTTGNNTFVTNGNTFQGPPNRRAYDLGGGIWETDQAGNLYTVNYATHVASKVGQMTVAGAAMALNGAGNMCFSPSGQLFLANSGTLYTVNTATLAATPVLALGVNDVNISFGQQGLIYATDSNGHEYSVNPTTLVYNTPGTLAGGNAGVPTFNALTSSPEFVNVSTTVTAAPTIFQTGHTAAYTVNLTNGGPATADGGTTVTVALGTGLTFGGVAGTAWTAVASTNPTTGATTVVMTYGQTVVDSGNAATATLTVNVTSSAHLSAVSTFTVAADDQFDTGVGNTITVATNTVA